ncbi:unnamed protein product [Arctogadus glacialis]
MSVKTLSCLFQTHDYHFTGEKSGPTPLSCTSVLQSWTKDTGDSPGPLTHWWSGNPRNFGSNKNSTDAFTMTGYNNCLAPCSCTWKGAGKARVQQRAHEVSGIVEGEAYKECDWYRDFHTYCCGEGPHQKVNWTVERDAALKIQHSSKEGCSSSEDTHLQDPVPPGGSSVPLSWNLLQSPLSSLLFMNTGQGQLGQFEKMAADSLLSTYW